MKTKKRKLSELKKLPNNPRTIKDKAFKSLCESIKNNPEYFEARPLILSNRTGELVIIAGNQRYEAAKHLKLAEVPTFLIENLTEEKEKEIIIRDNVANGEWDFDILANEWSDFPLIKWGVEIPSFDLSNTSNKIEIAKEYMIIVELENEQEQEKLYNNLINTEDPHKQIRSQIQIRMIFSNIPRSVIYEFDRHPIGKHNLESDFFSDDNRPTIQSTRYSLNQIKDDKRIYDISEIEKHDSPTINYDDCYEYIDVYDIVKDYYYIPDNDFINYDEKNNWLILRLEDLINIYYYKTKFNMTNDKLKKYINEYLYAENIVCSCTGEWLFNFLTQRLDTKSFYQIRELAINMYNAIPDDFKPFFKVYKYKIINNLDKEKIENFLEKMVSSIEFDFRNDEGYKLIKQLLNKNIVEKEYLI